MKLARSKKASPKPAKVKKASPKPAKVKKASPKPAKVKKASPKPAKVKKASPKPVKKVSPKSVSRVPQFPICLKFRVEWYDESTNSYDGRVNTSLLKSEVKQAFVNAIQNTFINSLKYVYFGPSDTISDINITFEPSSYIKMTGSLPYNPNTKRYEMTFEDSVKAINRKNIDQYEYSGSWAVFDGERYYKLDSVEFC